MLRLAWPRAARAVLAGVLILVVTVILAYFISHRRPPTVVPGRVADIPAEQVEKQEGIEHLEFRGDRTIQVKAGSWHRGEDGRFFLEKNVEVHDLAGKGGREIHIAGDKVVYDKDWTEARLEGNAKVRLGDLQFESSDFDYRKGADVLSTEHGVVISSPKLSGTASRMTYSFKDEIIRLEGSVSLQAKGGSAEDEPVMINGNVLTYRRLERKGRGEGEAGFSLGQSRGRAEALDFRLTDDEQYLLDFSLKGGARISVVEDQGPAGGNPALDPDAGHPGGTDGRPGLPELEQDPFRRSPRRVLHGLAHSRRAAAPGPVRRDDVRFRQVGRAEGVPGRRRGQPGRARRGWRGREDDLG